MNAMPDKWLRHRAAVLDRQDPLSFCRERFSLPDSLVYLDGNSLGAMPVSVPARVLHAVAQEWGRDLIRSWNAAGWLDLPLRAAARIAPLVGAHPDCIAVSDSTSVNLFKLLATACRLRPDRRTILTEKDNFPSDLYVAEGLRDLLSQGHRIGLAESAEQVEAMLGRDTAVLMLTHVNYRTGQMHDMDRLTRAAHRAGALVLWDLAHSAGAVELDLEGAEVDMAVGCGYKYLNGGPGAPAFLYLARRLICESRQPIAGWLSHREPFAFHPTYEPAEGISRFQAGTPPILSLMALESALEVWKEVDMAEVRRKSLALTDLFMDAVETFCHGHGLRLLTPRQGERRGSQVSYSLDQDGYAVIQALIARNVVGDFRAPDIIRFGFAPLYNRFADALRAAEMMGEVLGRGDWKKPQFRRRLPVT